MPARLSILAAARPPTPAVSRHAAAGELALAIGAFAGRVQPLSMARLARDAGLPESRLADLAAGRALPDLAEFLSLCAVLPSEFADIALAPAGLGGARRITALNGDGAGEGAEASRLAARAAELTALIGLEIGSGEPVPLAAAEAEPIVRALKARCERWLARGASTGGVPPSSKTRGALATRTRASTTSPSVSPTDPPGGAAAHPRARRPAPCPPSGRPA